MLCFFFNDTATTEIYTLSLHDALPISNAKILIHQVSSGFQGQATDIEIHAREVIELRRRLDEIIAQHSGKDVEKVRTDTERDYFMSSEEAKEYGIIDRVISEH